jgi:hypothetical protein
MAQRTGDSAGGAGVGAVSKVGKTGGGLGTFGWGVLMLLAEPPMIRLGRPIRSP